jgi:septal ring factor EnvC (AmiA/AmiB activator)
MQAAERARAADLAAQQEAAARASAAAEAAAHLSEQRVAAAARLRAAERATADIAERIEALARRKQAAEAALRARAAAMAPLLPLIERLSLYPAETLLAVPASADRALRGVLVLQGLGAQLEQEARGLRAEQTEVAKLTVALQAESPRLEAARAAQAAQAADLDRQFARTQADLASAEAAAAAALQSAADNARTADSLRAVIAAVEADRRAAETRAAEDAARAARHRHAAEAEEARRAQLALAQPGTLSPDARPQGQLTAPVAGLIIRAWGEPTDAGPANGISYQAAPAARVTAPCAGRVMFAAPFRSYGLLVILDCGGGTRAVLAGMARLDVQAGTRLAAGEPLGTMADWDPRVAGPRPVLYLELRRGDTAVDPMPWLKARG